MGLQLNEIDRFNLLKQLVNKPDVFQQYDPTVKVPREALEDLIDVAIQAPSSWEKQHWKFLIFEDPKVKEEHLYPIAGSQPYIRDASAVVAVLGDRQAYEHMKQVENSSNVYSLERIQGEQLPVPFVEQDNTKDLSTPPLAAIQFMMGAAARGYDTYPTLHFDSLQLAKTFNIPNQFVPVMLIAVGKRKESSGSTFSSGVINEWL
ncbi:nitroreductase family protein [Pontibacillus marinus]|uniref:Nitroreductase domain-containing protein n=1 Tax=Pontibacillus marinus BH030004 = DSM 16465 TaxID=1385511 RepID=A0A0A5FXU1_9BACI|nr:nitroreductase family protein [Pontibacillus marinus]KGX83635.1 hypothetical protein N783_01900 [Pontibacillus marinus BH030004 = DSM 16465]